MMGITTKTVPVEAHWSIGKVERYYAVLRRAYQIVSEELPDLDKEMALQMAVKAVNDTAGPNGLVPTLLVFGAFPRMSELDPPAPSIAQRAAAAKKAINEIKELRAKMQVQEALNHRNGPLTTVIHDLPINSEVLVWREGNARKTGSWKGPFKLLEVSGETCILQLPHGPTKFRTMAVKPFYSDDSTSLDEPNLPSNLPTIPQDKEVELDIEPEMRRHTTIEVKVPPPHTTGEPEPVRRRRGRPHKNALSA